MANHDISLKLTGITGESHPNLLKYCLTGKHIDTGRETISLSFARVAQEYVIQNQQGRARGTVSFGFDIQANREA